MSIAWLFAVSLWLSWWWHSYKLKQQVSKAQQQQTRQIQTVPQHIPQVRDNIMDAIQEVILCLDYEGSVVSLNQQAKKTFLYSRHLELPQPMIVLHRDSDWLESLHEAMQQLPQPSTLPTLMLNDRVYLPRLSALGAQQAILLCIDITEAHRMQEQRKAFTANLMHDLKTPLTSLLGYARSIESFYDDEALCRESAAVIAKEAKHVNDLLNSLLSVEHIEQHQPSDAHCDAASICRDVWQSLEHELQNKDLECVLDVVEPCEVSMQASDVTRIITNIASNAIRYTHVDTRITCTLHQQTLTIKDRGIGVPEQDIPHLCERFYRVDSVRSSGSGHGLGLAIVYETLQRDGGSLHIKNRKHGGLCVQVHFPT